MSNKNVKNNSLVEDYMPLAYSIAYKYQNKGIELEELQGLAIEGLVKARDYYDPEKGSFSNAVIMCVRSELKNAFQKQSLRINTYMECNPIIYSDRSEIIQLIDIIEDKEPLSDVVIDTADTYNIIIQRIDAYLDELDTRKKYIIKERFFKDPAKTFEELALQLNISHQRVHQLESRALEILKEKLTDLKDDISF